MRRAELRLIDWTIADAIAELRIWLDHYNCVPLSFEISKLPNGGVCVSIKFSEDHLAARFEREFGR